MEGAAIVESLARQRQEVLHVPGRFVGRELEAERAEVGSDHGFQIVGGLPQRGGHRAEEKSEKRGAHRFYRNFLRRIVAPRLARNAPYIDGKRCFRLRTAHADRKSTRLNSTLS